MDVAKEKNPEALVFIEELKDIQAASRASVKELQENFDLLESEISALTNHAKSATSEFKEKFDPFLNVGCQGRFCLNYGLS